MKRGYNKKISELPNEIIISILQNLSKQEILKVTCLNKHLQCLARDPSLWRALKLKNYPSASESMIAQIVSRSKQLVVIDVRYCVNVDERLTLAIN